MMKYYAAEGRVSQRPIEGGIEISEEQYQAALAGIAQGHVVTIEGGFAVGPKPEPEPEPEPEPDPDPVPVYKSRFSPLEYLDRFTEAEQLAVVSATMTVPEVKLWYDRMLAASYVDLDDPRTEAGIDALIAAELIAPERKAALMDPELIE